MNLFENIPKNASEELFTEVFAADGVRIERIVSYGQASPDGFWYDQKDNEWVLLLEGSATLNFEEGDPVDLKPGDHVYIPTGKRHRVEKTAEKRRTVWLAVFMGGRINENTNHHRYYNHPGLDHLYSIRKKTEAET